MLKAVKHYTLQGDTVGSYIAFCAMLGGAASALLFVSTL